MTLPHHLTPAAREIPNGDLAAAVARQRLRSRATDHPVAPLRDCIQIGRAVGLSMAEMQRVSGLGRQTLYRHLKPAHAPELRNPPRPQASIEVLMLLAAEGGYGTPAGAARRASLPAPLVLDIAVELDDAGLCTIRRDSYSSIEAALSPEGDLALREHFDDLYLRRPDAIGVYLRVPENHVDSIRQAAGELLEGQEHTLMPQAIAPSVMTGPELALAINAPTVRRALVVARDIWGEIVTTAKVPDPAAGEAVVANVIPPGTQPVVQSGVLDTYLEAMVDAGAPNVDALKSVREKFAGGATEHQLAGRCATSAALALRRAVGNQRDPNPVVDGDSAFAELVPARGVPVPRELAAIKKGAVSALDLATDHLGPVPGGRLGSFRVSGDAPVVIDSQRATHAQLVEIAAAAGHSVGSAASVGVVDGLASLERVVAGGGD